MPNSDRRFPHNTFHINTPSDRPRCNHYQSAFRPNHGTEPQRRPNDTQYTPLNVTITHILHTVKDPKILPAPRPMTAPRDKRSRDKYCTYHEDVEHPMDECYGLKKNIKG